MGPGKFLALAIVIAAGPALGQSDEAIDKAAGSQMQAYMWCIRYHISEAKKADLGATDKQLVARANLACEKERKALWERLQKEPLNMPPAEATRQLDEAVADIKPGIPKSEAKADPFGTFAQSGRQNLENGHGYQEWDDTLIIREDGTAELKSKYKQTFYSKWHASGCDDSVKSGSAVFTQKYSVTVEGSTVSFKLRGLTDVAGVEPSCWTFSTEGFFRDWSLEWNNGRLRNNDGEYFRQD